MGAMKPRGPLSRRHPRPVASEVKAPAEQTAKATGQISEQIAEVLSSTPAAVDAIEEICRVIERVEALAAPHASGNLGATRC